MTKILIIRFSSIGDIVLITPVLRAIKEQFDGETEIHVLTKRSYATVLDGNPNIAKVHTIEKSTQEVMSELKSENFDYIIDLHNNIRSFQVKRICVNAVCHSFPKLNVEKWLYVKWRIGKLPDLHIVDRYFKAAECGSARDYERRFCWHLPGKSTCSQGYFYSIKCC